jgi:hypothetical protein
MGAAAPGRVVTRVQEFIYLAAAYLPVWRDAAIVLLAGVVIGCLWLYAEATG